jgi:hypothetical protein
MRYDEDERVASCQREIQRLRSVIWELEEEIKRYKTMAYQAVVMWKEDALYDCEEEEFQDRVMEQLDITEEEYKGIMED